MKSIGEFVHIPFEVKGVINLNGHLHVINIAGVGHLLNVYACFLLGTSDGSDDSVLDDVLQIRKSTPDVPKVLEGVCPGTRVPIATKEDENQYAAKDSGLNSSWTGCLTHL